jgi:AraC family transcriptional regulator of adaptative response / DNA-3-methyladenine glycosylase II
MTLTDDAAYQAMSTHDARFDGRFFVGVTTTGIYCRPVCRVRLPLRRNCRFFANAVTAEQGGFRPCLRCRPEQAPGLSLTDSSPTLAAHAARMIDQAVRDGDEVYLAELAARLGVTDRHLRRIFAEAIGVTPIAYLTTRRLLLAKALLTDTALPVTQVALASGFASVRRFNTAFAEHYRMQPTALRRERNGAAVPGTASGRRRSATAGDAVLAAAADTDAASGASGPDAIEIRLAYRPPYDIPGVLGFLARRAIVGVETGDTTGMARTLALVHQGRRHAGWVRIGFDAEHHRVRAEVSTSLVPALGAVVPRLRRVLDRVADPALIDPVLAGLPLSPRPGVRVPGAVDGFEAAVRVILGQQVTVAAARTLTRRLVERFGEPLATPVPGLDRLFPSAEAIAAADSDAIGSLGIVRQRSGALQALARAMRDGTIRLDAAAPLATTLDALRALPGIGEWTVQLIALRALGWPDAWPGSDIGLLNALGTRDVAAAAAQAEAWRPWRGYALMRLWQTLEA